MNFRIYLEEYEFKELWTIHNDQKRSLWRMGEKAKLSDYAKSFQELKSLYYKLISLKTNQKKWEKIKEKRLKETKELFDKIKFMIKQSDLKGLYLPLDVALSNLHIVLTLVDKSVTPSSKDLL